MGVRNRGQGSSTDHVLPQHTHGATSSNMSKKQHGPRRLRRSLRAMQGSIWRSRTAITFVTLFWGFYLWGIAKPKISIVSYPRTLILVENDVFQTRPWQETEWKPVRLVDIKDPKVNPKEEAKHNRYRMILDDEETDCPFIADWQTQTSAMPNCNILHEVGIQVGNPGLLHRLKHLDSGGYMDVWGVLNEDDTSADFVLKTPLYEDCRFEPKDYGGPRRDALVMDMASFSPNVLNMHGYCGQSGLVQRARGSLRQWLKKYRWTVSPIKLLQVAVMVAQGVADMHLFHNGMATVAHSDVKPPQFLMTSEMSEDPVIKLNDFNRCAHLTSKNPPEICPFYIDALHRGSTFRSPEEYVRHGPQTDKIDVFSLGSVLYYILTRKEPFEDEAFKDASKMIIGGTEPELPDFVQNSTDPSLAAIVEAMQKCRQIRANDRPQSREIAQMLKDALERIKGMKP